MNMTNKCKDKEKSACYAFSNWLCLCLPKKKRSVNHMIAYNGHDKTHNFVQVFSIAGKLGGKSADLELELSNI